MRYSIVGAAALVAVAGTSLAYAQPAPPPPSPRLMAGDSGPMTDMPTPPPPPRGPDGPGPRDRGPMPPPPSPAAHFRVERGPSVVDVKCEDGQPMKACADIVETLVDRLPTERGR
jgi:hypothetical protein